jgi:hypothetical protein
MVLTHDAVKLMKLSDLRLIEDNQPHVFGTKIIKTFVMRTYKVTLIILIFFIIIKRKNFTKAYFFNKLTKLI